MLPFLFLFPQRRCFLSLYKGFLTVTEYSLCFLRKINLLLITSPCRRFSRLLSTINESDFLLSFINFLLCKARSLFREVPHSKGSPVFAQSHLYSCCRRYPESYCINSPLMFIQFLFSPGIQLSQQLYYRY